MKNFIFVLLGFAIMGLMVSCEKDQEALPASQETLIQYIAQAGDVDMLAPEDVPTQIHNFIEENFHPYQIEMAFHARGLGYEMMLENGLCIFFDNNGGHLNHDGIHNDWSNSHRGDYHCMMGDTLDVDMIPELVQTFIADNYPDLTIRYFVLKPSGKLCVELGDDLILMFGTGGELLTECQAFSNGMGNGGAHHRHNHKFGTSSGGQCDSTMVQTGGNPGHPMHPGNQGNVMGHGYGDGGIGPCWGGTSIPLTDLPADITNYLDLNYPDVELLFAMQNFNGYYMLRLEDCVRLVFDENGVLLFDSGN
ncbi:MAG: hypothetical protein DRI69_04620 [Bacteroidetes bacterium]|nr:MAG: hypothetical protein DRI69_04620 [Bacteroidota bacterium]